MRKIKNSLFKAANWLLGTNFGFIVFMLIFILMEIVSWQMYWNAIYV